MITANDHLGISAGGGLGLADATRAGGLLKGCVKSLRPYSRQAAKTPGPVGYEPAHLWSHDDSYVARRGKDKNGSDIVSIYEPSMALLGKISES